MTGTSSAATARELKTINPATEEVLNEYKIMTKEQINEKVKSAQNAFSEWKKDIQKRAEYLYHVAHVFRQDKERLAKVITNEMGKAIKEARSEVEKCAWVMEYYADNGRVFVTDEVVNTDARKSFITFEPLGVIGSIMPWNFPYWQALRFASPSLMAGNTIVLKPASATMQCGIEIEKAFEKAGVPQPVFQTIVGDCIATKRFFVVKKVANEFVEKFVQKTEKLRVGDPLSDDTDLGPLVNASSLKTIDSQVKDSVKEGAEILTGGEQTRSKGYFYKPTILKNVSSNMRVAQEEVFGPVAPIVVADSETEALRLANDSQYGLGASIWTEDLDKAERLSRMVRSGIVTVNNVVISDPRVPFGGIKNSGFGRELSRYGMLEFVNIKSVRFYDQLVHQHHVE